MIYDLSERAPAGNVLAPLFRIDSVHVYTENEAIAAGTQTARKRGVALWIQRGIEVELIANYRGASPQEPRTPRKPRG